MSTRVCDDLYDLYLSAGTRSTKWTPVADRDARLRREPFGRQFPGTSDGRMSAAIRAWKRWLKWVRAPGASWGIDAWAPEPLHLGAFLLHVSSGGPTAACNQWLRHQLGLQFPNSAPLIISFKDVPLGHVPTQVRELPSWAFVNLLRLTRAKRGAVPRFLRQTLQLAAARLRWQRQARPRVVRIASEAIV